MQKADKLMNFSGKILWKDIDILTFSVKDGIFEEWHLHLENSKYFPLVFRYDQSYDGLSTFIEDRLMPRTRQNLQIALKSIGLDEYSWDGIIKANYGLCTDDCYWFKPAGSALAYNDIKIRD